MKNEWFFISYLFLSLFGLILSQNHNFNNAELNGYENVLPKKSMPQFVLIKQFNGTTVTLNCSISHCNHNRKYIKWEINRLGNFNGEWKRVPNNQSHIIPCLGNKKISNLEVKIENNTQYRCVNKNLVVKVFQLEVKEPKKPSVLEITPNVNTPKINSQLILQCKVYSSVQPLEIYWFKQCDNCKKKLMFNSTGYIRINTSDNDNVIQRELNIYISKLQIYKVGPLDDGVYACVGVNANYYDVKTLSVSIQHQYNWEPHISFSLLFLIPLAFALVPITVWLCYYRNRQKQHHRVVFQERKMYLKRNNPQVPIL
ncbi:uncharacterized protein [Onthophagus taurus]|uniref:uncharacterized protein n=1 Tax=Onthophagus taurus TaxID=166361 RepID=UPI0039BDBC82